MEEDALDLLPANSKCTNCLTELTNYSIYCPHCSYPINGTQEERERFESRTSAESNLTQVIKKEAKKTKRFLLVTAFVFVIYGLFLVYLNHEMTTLLAPVIMVLVYGCLAFISLKSPFISSLIAMILYVGALALQFVYQPELIAEDLIWKAAILLLLLRTIKSGIEVKQIRKQISAVSIKK